MFGLPKTQLDVEALRLTDLGAIAIATAIREETEVERERQREKFPDEEGDKALTTNSIVGLLSPEGYRYSYANGLRWDQLLATGDCASRVGVRTGLKSKAVIDFALENCDPPEWRMLFWFGIAHEQIELSTIQRRISDAERAARVKAFSKQQSARARKLHQQNPEKVAKQRAKDQVKELWELWEAQPDRYLNVSKFAHDMFQKFDELESTDVIQRWVREWRSKDVG